MSQEKSGIQGFIEELRRRRVFRVAAVYLGAAFVILEASEMIFPRLGLPDWTVTFILSILALGFPISVILAWAFEVTPEGMSRARKTDKKQTTAEKPLTSNLIIIGLLVVIAILLAYPNFTRSDSAGKNTLSADPKSIAVLPFTSFSESKESEYFSDGMTDVILTQLAKIRDLKVISRTSIMQYKNTEKPIKEIAAELGVANVLEGSVQRAGDQVRIVSQLIKADSDEHLWAETYDRDYADIFSVQSEVARAIAAAMKVALTPEEKTYLQQKPTENQEAWDLFVRAKILWDDFTVQDNSELTALLNQAADLDAQFLLPRGYLVRQYTNNYFNRRENAEDDLPKARQRLDEMTAVKPNAPETHLAQGYYHYYVSLEFTRARDEFLKALEHQPNNADLYEALAYINRRLGNWDEAYAHLTKSAELDPNAGGKIGELLGFSFQMRKLDAIERYAKRLILMDRSNPGLRSLEIYLPIMKTGDLSAAKNVLDSLEQVLGDEELVDARRIYAYFSRDYQTALEITYQDTSDQIENRARLHHLMGNMDSTRFYFDSLRTRLSKRLETETPIFWMYNDLGRAEAALGNEKAALNAISKARNLISMEDDAFAGGTSLLGQSEIYLLLGKYDEVLAIYEQLLAVPSEANIQNLILDPQFDELRSLPKYKELVRKHKPAGWSSDKSS